MDKEQARKQLENDDITEDTLWKCIIQRMENYAWLKSKLSLSGILNCGLEVSDIEELLQQSSNDFDILCKGLEIFDIVPTEADLIVKSNRFAKEIYESMSLIEKTIPNIVSKIKFLLE